MNNINSFNELEVSENSKLHEISEFENSHSSDDLESNEGKEQVEVSKEFREHVVKYVKIDDIIRKKDQEIRDLKSMRRPCEEYILKYLDEIDETTIEIGDGKLRKNKSENKVPLNKDYMKIILMKKLGNAQLVNNILDEFENRPKKIQTNLKRTGKRATKKKTESNNISQASNASHN